MVEACEKPEILAPAGGWECAKAAVENGAGAIYFGVGKFNARARADNFVLDDLPKLMRGLHRRGVRGYVTFNTLVFTDELAEAEENLRQIIATGVDAAIVQDVGIARLIRKISPDFPIHASTQMTITSAAGVDFARKIGASLAVISRECSLAEIEKIQNSQQAGMPTLALETFVHGALCVAYSGQCLTSESLGGRSANRGECAQACRLPYELICDGEALSLGGRRYLLSPRDLAGVEILPDLIRLGVRSLKIEGRLKSPEYVAAMTQVYRDSLDRIWTMFRDGAPRETLAEFARELSRHHAYKMEMAFSRGLYTGWFRGINNRELVHARFGKKRGVFLGEIAGFGKDGIFANLRAPLKPGDGVVFDAGTPEEKEEGGYVYSVENARENAPARNFIGFARAGIRWERVRRGDKIWKTADVALIKNLRESFAGDLPRWTRPVEIFVRAKVGEKLFATMRDEFGNEVSAESERELVAAENKPATAQYLREQFARIGNTGLHLGAWECEIFGGPLAPASVANKVRRALVEQILEARERRVRWTLSPSVAGCNAEISHKISTKNSELKIIPVIREIAQLESALELGFGEIYCEFENPKNYKPAAEKAHAAGALFWAQAPRIFKPGDDAILEIVKNCGADGFLARNHEHLRAFAGKRLRGDFSLNVANTLSAEYFLRELGLESVTASYDMNFEQLRDLLAGVTEPENIEVVIHQHMPMFHMEHCVFCAFLSEGKNFRDCGRPCEKHAVKLRDRTGQEHLLKADAACRNTLYNARAQTGAEFFREIADAGARRFRVEFVDESAARTREILLRYRELFSGKIDGNALWRALRLESRLGVTRGTLKPTANFRRR
ncbi:MAG: U32 family peptidase [Opitutae bacterium]|nr:U32 family peptidase [Opitutae bacterium]